MYSYFYICLQCVTTVAQTLFDILAIITGLQEFRIPWLSIQTVSPYFITLNKIIKWKILTNINF